MPECNFNWGNDHACQKCGRDKKKYVYLPRALWAEAEELLHLRERYMDMMATKEEKMDVAKEMKTKALDLAKDTAELTKQEDAQQQATQQEIRVPTTVKKPKGAKGGKEKKKASTSNTATTTQTDASASAALASVALASVPSGQPATSSAAPAPAQTTTAGPPYSFMDDGFAIVDTPTNSPPAKRPAPNPYTTHKNKRGSKSFGTAGRSVRSRKRSFQDAPPLPASLLSRPVNQAEAADNQPIGLGRRMSGPVEVRLSTALPASKEVADMSQALESMGRMMFGMHGSIQRLKEEVTQSAAAAARSEGHLARLVQLLENKMEDGEGGVKRKRREEQEEGGEEDGASDNHSPQSKRARMDEEKSRMMMEGDGQQGQEERGDEERSHAELSEGEELAEQANQPIALD
ncbi:hypothetical protein KEM55_005295 [Ascosphaera atra]|nr:hypothetical protein KEM55_005295 [Ascosphaera atra]